MAQEVAMIIWVYDENNREYFDKNGVKHSSPIYREYWQPHEVVGETRVSWLLRDGTKVAKNPARRSRVHALTEQEVEDDIFVHEHRHGVADAIYRIADAQKLAQVAAIIGYDIGRKSV